MRVLLDTVTFLYVLQSPERLSRLAKKIVETPTNVLELSVLSFSEIALKKAVGKLSLTRDSLEAAVNRLQLNILAYTQEHALELFDLPTYHRDPFDRQLIAQAIVEKIPVVTCDEQFLPYKQVKVIW